jgi:ATP-binding cassette subfamily C protein CydD
MIHVHWRLLRLAGDIRRHVLSNTILGLLVSATYAIQAVLIALVLAGIFEGASFGEVVGLLVGVAVAIVVRAALLWLREIAAQLTTHAVKESLRSRVYERLLALGPGYLIRKRTGDVQTTAVEGVEALEAYFGRYLPTVGVSLLGPTAILAYLVWLDPILAGVVLAFALFTVLAPRWWDRVTAEKGEAHWRAYTDLGAEYLDNMQGITTLKAFNAVDRRRDELRDKANHLYDTTMGQLRAALFDTGITTFGMLAGVAGAIGIGAVRVAEGTLELSTLFIVLLLARECYRPLGELSQYWHVGFNGLSSSRRIAALLEAEPEVREPSEPISVSVSELTPRLDIEDVTFSYSSRERPALRGLSLTVEPDETVAVVGPSGAGKSTIVSLLLRFFDPQEGRVLLGGRDLRELPLETVRAAIAVVSQETYLFHGTIAENIRFARPGATDAEVRRAAKSANVHRFVCSLPEGYETQVGERGLSLSGGQRQRIAIARALLKDAPILVLDEATSNVDAASEAAIQETLDRITTHRTTLVIAHRLSTVRNADRIVVLSEGAITESGRHADLLQRQGDYARLVAIQKGT